MLPAVFTTVASRDEGVGAQQDEHTLDRVKMAGDEVDGSTVKHIHDSYRGQQRRSGTGFFAVMDVVIPRAYE